MLPGRRYPDAWSPEGLEPGYHLRMDREYTYLIYGGEDVVARWPNGLPLGPRAHESAEALADAIRRILARTIRQHKRKGGLNVSARTYVVGVNEKKFEIGPTASAGQAAKEAINAYLDGKPAEEQDKELHLTLNIKQVPKVREVGGTTTATSKA